MPATDLQPWMVYWPAATLAGAVLAVLVALLWIGTHLSKIKAARETISTSRKQLDEARVLAKQSSKRVKARRKEMRAIHKTAGKLFWRTEKTWIG